MTLKATWLWNGSSSDGRHVFGFSESWYTDLSGSNLVTSMDAISQKRVQLFGQGVNLFGYRIADTTPNSRAYTLYSKLVLNPPPRNGRLNVPQDAALCQILGSVAGTIKRFWLHALPDDAVSDANFTDGLNIVPLSRDFINALAADSYKFRYTVPGSPISEIVSIAANGDVVLQAPLVGAALFSTVQLFHVRGVDGRGKRGKFKISAFVDTQHFTLGRWPGDVVGASGKLRLTQYGFTTFPQLGGGRNGDDPTVRPGIRKCGRPFGQLRGRAVARR